MKFATVETKKAAPLPVSRDEFHIEPSRENIEKPIKQYLNFAFRRSTRDAESYEEAAALVYDENRLAFLLEMAWRKRDEAERLYYYYKINGTRALQDIRKRTIISHPHYQPELDPATIASTEDTYSFAFEKEQHNFELYSKLAGLDSNPYTKILFEYLSNLEKEHIAFIEGRFMQATVHDIWDMTMAGSIHRNG
jgi:rubrerythrin